MSAIQHETLFRCDWGRFHLLIGPRLTLARLEERNAESQLIDTRHLMRQVLHRPGSSAALRRCCADWGLPTVALWQIDDGALADWLAAQMKRGSLAIARVPDHQIEAGQFEGVELARSAVLTSLRAALDSDPRNQGTGAMLAAIAPSMRGTGPLPTSQPGTPALAAGSILPQPPAPASGPLLNPAQVQTMPPEDRLVEVLHRTMQGSHLSNEAKQHLERVLGPEAIAATVAVLAVWTGSQAVGVGFLVDMLILAVGVFSVGTVAIEGVRKLAEFLDLTRNARDSSDLDKASMIFASAIALLGVATFMRLITRGANGVHGATKT